MDIASWFERLLDGSLVAGGVFLMIGIAGAVLLLVSLLLDGLFDALDFGDGPLSLTTIAAFTAIFGFAAFACVGAGMSTSLASVLGALAGLLGGAAAWWLTRLIRGAESNTAVSGEDLVGSTASVVLAIPEAGLGEVALVRHGERISLSATADRPIARGTAVRIAQIVTSTSVRVEPVRVEPVRPEPPQVEPVRPEPRQDGPAQAEPIRVEPARAEPMPRDASGLGEPDAPETAQPDVPDPAQPDVSGPARRDAPDAGPRPSDPSPPSH